MALPETEKSRPRSYLWWGLAAAALLIGYADLVRGGITVSAVFLTVGYFVLVPVAILK